MIKIRCAACGQKFEIPDDQSGESIQCSMCRASILVPVIGPSELEKKAKEGEKTPETLAPTKAIEKPHRLFSPLEVVLVFVILGVMIAFVIYKFQAKPAVGPSPEALAAEEIIRQEARLSAACAANLKSIAAALMKYREQHNTLPEDLDILKETGVLEPGIPLFCKKQKYAYFMDEAVAAQSVMEDPVIVADSQPVHTVRHRGRNVIRLSGKVEFLKEEEFARIFALQQAEFEKLDSAKTREVREKLGREKKATELMDAAAGAFKAGKPVEAIKLYKQLLDEYASTDVVKKFLNEIKIRIVAINFNTDLEDIRLLVQQLLLDEAKTKYRELAKNASDEQNKTLEAELENIELVEQGRSLRLMGDLKGAQDIFKKLGSENESPFWKRMAHGLSAEIDKYREEAALLLESAQAAEKAGRKTRALSLYMSLSDNYPDSTEAPKARPRIAKLVNEVPYRGRFLPKDKLVEKKAATAIKNGLAWLARKQELDGSWKNISRGKTALDEISLTALVTLCFLAEGSTHLSGPYREVVKKAVEHLKAAQKSNGLLGEPVHPNHRLAHAISLLVLCELLNMTDDEAFTDTCRKAVKYTIKILEPGRGWRFADEKSTEDVILTTWMQLAMLSARAGKIKFLSDLLEGALNTYNAHSDLQGRVDYEKLQDPTRPQRRRPQYQKMLIATAAAAYGRLASGSDPASGKLKGAVELMRANFPNGTRTNFPYFLFGTYAHWQGDELTFREWNWALESVLIPAQLREGGDAGAWDMGHFSDFRAGKVYPTALAVLALQVPYNHFAGVNRRAEAQAPSSRPEVTIIFKDGSRLTGRLISEADDKVTIEITKGTTTAEMVYRRADIESIERK